jgi:hypothetical protein
MFHGDVDGPSACWLRSVDLPFSEINSRQIVQAVCNVEMVRAQRLFPNCQSTFVELLGLGIAAFLPVECGQIGEAVGNIGMVWAERFVTDRQRPFVERLSLGRKALAPVKLAQIV